MTNEQAEKLYYTFSATVQDSITNRAVRYATSKALEFGPRYERFYWAEFRRLVKAERAS